MQNRNIFLAVGIGLGVGLLLTRRKAGAEAGKYFDFEKQVYVTPQDAIAQQRADAAYSTASLLDRYAGNPLDRIRVPK